MTHPPAADAPAEARLGALVARATSLYEDVDFRSVTAWKAAAPGRRAIGFLPIYVPREVIHAAGALPVGILGSGDQVEIVRGDSYFQSYICHLPRGVIELAVSGRLKDLDGFVFPSICDVVRNLSGMFKLLSPEKFVHYLDLPQNFAANLGGQFYVHEMRTIAAGVSALTGVEVTDERLRNSIAVYNANRAAVAALLRARSEAPWQVSTAETYLLLRAGYLLPVEEHTAFIHEYLAAARESARRPLDNIRVLVRGAFCEQPPLALLRTLERAGCYVVDDDFVLGAHFLREPVDTEGDPWTALSEAFLRHAQPTASVYDEKNEKGARLVQRVREQRVDGVILMAPSFCDPALLDQPMLEAALEAARIAHTSFKYSEDTGQFQVIREQSGTFADAIKLWGTT